MNTTTTRAMMNNVFGKYRLHHKFRLAKWLILSLTACVRVCMIHTVMWVVCCWMWALSVACWHAQSFTALMHMYHFCTWIVWVPKCLARFCFCCCYFNLLFLSEALCMCLLSYAVNHNCCQTSFWVASFSVRASFVCIIGVVVVLVVVIVVIAACWHTVAQTCCDCGMCCVPFYGNQTAVLGISFCDSSTMDFWCIIKWFMIHHTHMYICMYVKVLNEIRRQIYEW